MSSPRILLRLVAAAFILTGLFFIARLGYVLVSQQSGDATQARQWKALVDAAAGPAAGSTPAAGATPGAEATPLTGGIYLKLTVPRLGKDGVAINSDWTGLKRAGMVHYALSPAPGEKGNVLLAFHRETHWYEINQLHAGDDVQLETTDRKVYTYRIDFVKVVNPSNVDLLKATEGHDLTMITCDPIWQDYNRMIFRAHLASQ